MAKKIGILCPVRFSIFSSGTTSVALNLYDYLTEFGFTVHLLNILPSNGINWFDDCSQLTSQYIVKNLDSITTPEYDIVIDIDAATIGEKRRICAKKVIVFFRKPVILNDIESIVYPVNNKLPHYVEDVDAIFIYDFFSEYDVQYLQLLVPNKPIFRIPFLWRPKIIESYHKEVGIKHWSQMNPVNSQARWNPHVMESNLHNNSSCILPMVIFRQLILQNAFNFDEYTIHNMEQLNNSDYFRDNIKKTTEHPSLKANFIGRQRAVDLVIQQKSVLVSHIRFISFRPIHIDSLWAGVPIIHNSILLRDIGHGLERFYYRDNDILDSIQAFKNLESDYNTQSGFFDMKNQEEIRKEILIRFSGFTEEYKNLWKPVLAFFNDSFDSSTVPSTVPSTVSSVIPSTITYTIPKTTTLSSPKKVYTILFTDMWDAFNPEYNFFLLLLNESAKSQNILVKGYSLDTINLQTPDLLIFGPFGKSYLLFPNIPKMHYTGENSPPIWGNSNTTYTDNIKLNVGYSLLERSDETYMRIPLWMLEIDWFGADANQIRNPKPLPIDCVTHANIEEKSRHQDRFCAFVVTNPLNEIRNQSFFWLSSYKQVDSAGRLFNNIGNEIFAGLGGGGGELLKHEFLKKYKFSLCFENSSAEGYTTEKLLHAKAAGCIPIYWGDPKVSRDFNDKGFINANNVHNAEDLIALVKNIDQDSEKYDKMYAEPLLDDYHFDLARRRLSEFARKIWNILDATICPTLPKFVGASSSKEAKGAEEKRDDTQSLVTIDTSTKIQSMVLVTFATERFLPFLQMWLSIFNQHKSHLPGIMGQVYLGEDISDSIKEQLEAQNLNILFRRLPTDIVRVPDFPDFWEAQHFAWKLWLVNDIANSISDRLVFYMDCGALLVRMPLEYASEVLLHGISLLEDPRQDNHHWCSQDFCNLLNVSETEKDSQQIWAGGFMFVGGHPLVKKLFASALAYAKHRNVIVGPKWEGVAADGKPFGHRHDQSILSILSHRLNISRFPLDKVYCDYSMQRTFKQKCALYVHRGNFIQHKDFLPKINEAHVINLARRSDRLKQFYNNHPAMEGPVIVDTACDGSKLQLTPMLHRLFINNDFHWKKPILGCAMSHLKLWYALANEGPEINTYLILEDDVKFKPGWENIWKQAVQYIPEDYDVLYLGGILPPNRTGYDQVIEQIAPFWSRIKEHSLYGQSPPNRYFHSCNYSYILTKEGAKKILNKIIANGGYYTSADHMVCNQLELLKHYFLTPLVAGCYQDDDPKYANSVFNDFSRVDGFDSDLWNNDVKFTEQERSVVPFENISPSFEKAIEDAFHNVEVIGTQKKKSEEELTNLIEPISTPIPEEKFIYFYSVLPHKLLVNTFMENQWITDLLELSINDGRIFGTPSKIITNEIKNLDYDHEPLSCKPIFIVQQPYIALYKAIFEKYEATKKDFYVLHLSDEYTKEKQHRDDITWYNLSSCKGVVRIYMREDIDTSKVVTIPLGYAKRGIHLIENPLKHTPSLPFREITWSFRGTGWNNRVTNLEVLKGVGNYRCVFYNDWNDPKQAGREEYIGELLNSKFVICPGGMNPETFRFYEALEMGAIPIYVREPGDELYFKRITETIQIISFHSWDDVANFMKHLLENPDQMEAYRNMLLNGWMYTKKISSDNMKRIWNYVQV